MVFSIVLAACSIVVNYIEVLSNWVNDVCGCFIVLCIREVSFFDRGDHLLFGSWCALSTE